jgi:hypothetical protein
MIELDQLWSQMLENAAEKAARSGRADVAEYLRLRSANDAIRSAAATWLIDSAAEIASNFQPTHRLLTIEREEPHRFEHERSRLVGTALRIQHGVRCLTVEAGWTRTPADGVMKGGALALARLRHRGMAGSDSILSLVLSDPLPLWRIHGGGEAADTEFLKQHVEMLLEMR